MGFLFRVWVCSSRTEVVEGEVHNILLRCDTGRVRETFEDGVVLEHQPELDGVGAGAFHC
jgi:hypothetical protein